MVGVGRSMTSGLRLFLGRYDKRNADHTNHGCDANQDLGVQTVVTERRGAIA